MRALSRRTRSTGRRRTVWLGAAVAALAAGAAGGFLFAWSGILDISASRGHFAITRWFLGFAMHNSVETHALSIDVPPLDEPWMLHLGLRHYDATCSVCHGAPGIPRNPIALQVVPVPPHLSDTVAEWTPAQLFWIIRNGLKYTAMPAWPALERDDEVWAVVAAMVRLPELDAGEYQRLVRVSSLAMYERIEESAQSIAAAGPVGEDLVACARCHGLRGEGGGEGAFPRLAGQTEAFLHQALRDYALGVRPSGVMQPIAAALTPDDMRELARHFASMTPPVSPAVSSIANETLHLGRSLAQTGRSATGVPPCAACHGPKDGPRDPLTPELSGQLSAYIERQLRLFRDGVFHNTAQARAMSAATRALTDEDIHAVSLFYAGEAM